MIWESLKLSLLIVGCAAVVVGTIGLACALLLAKYEFRGKELLDAVLTMPLVLPPTVTGYYLIVLLGRRGLIGGYIYDLTGWTFAFTWQGAVIAAVVVSLPLMTKAARASLESVNPDYEIASYTLGKNRFETFWRITLPLAKRGIYAGLILSFARAGNASPWRELWLPTLRSCCSTSRCRRLMWKRARNFWAKSKRLNAKPKFLSFILPTTQPRLTVSASKKSRCKKVAAHRKTLTTRKREFDAKLIQNKSQKLKNDVRRFSSGENAELAFREKSKPLLLALIQKSENINQSERARQAHSSITDSS